MRLAAMAVVLWSLGASLGAFGGLAFAEAPSRPAKLKFVAMKTDGSKSKSASASTSPSPSPSPKTKPKEAAKPDPLGACTKELAARKVAYKPAARLGIEHAVEIAGPLGGVLWTASGSATGQSLVIDCSLAVSLDEAGRYLRELGIDKAVFSSAYSRRTVRGSGRPSKHSYGLAIDVAGYSGPDLGALRVDRDYEQGLGDVVDCVGQPLTRGGAVLKVMQCQLARSGLFYLVLSPDYDDAHHDHFHLEVKPWSQRTELRSQALAIH